MILHSAATVLDLSDSWAQNALHVSVPRDWGSSSCCFSGVFPLALRGLTAGPTYTGSIELVQMLANMPGGALINACASHEVICCIALLPAAMAAADEGNAKAASRLIKTMAEVCERRDRLSLARMLRGVPSEGYADSAGLVRHTMLGLAKEVWLRDATVELAVDHVLRCTEHGPVNLQRHNLRILGALVEQGGGLDERLRVEAQRVVSALCNGPLWIEATPVLAIVWPSIV